MYTPRRAALTFLVARILSEPLFSQLRTREQLGYLVHSMSRRWATGVDSVEVLVQSPVRDPVYLHQRTLDMLHNFAVR